ncbi:MAG: LacI family DNA-binding transcriptional regulator [Bifidobacterium tsurumiense]|uniref:LacI family DNA-binding transcriptional regulator n=1 Tax=Bifidobacterium tsurumiense TaxID=356829 RepID=UPI002A7FD339|nr:LacI family DNA-binding transcriptional regulator [Bifidobacterium tsurumiense]MDY4678216.1 LacI family DNA-binding transcriptional regulator [Bifidobacterium tsurumiense]
MATLKEVAKAAGVSPSTASAALRGLNIVKPDTTHKVIDAASKLNYHINLSARALRSGHTNIFTLIIPDLENDFYAKLANSLADALFIDGCRLIIQISQYDSGKELELVKQQSSSLCDGLFICSTSNTATTIQGAAGDRPVLLFDDMSAPEEECYDSINTTSQGGMYALIHHLQQCGRKRIGIVGVNELAAKNGPRYLGLTLRKRRYAYALAALEQLYGSSEGSAINADWSVESGITTAHELVRQGMPFDALCCMNDQLAFGIMRGLAETGVNVPDDVAVTGFDGVNAGGFTTPTLTTMAIDFVGMAHSAVSMMRRQLELRESSSPMIPQHVIVGSRLLARESTLGRTASTGFTTR